MKTQRLRPKKVPIKLSESSRRIKLWKRLQTILRFTPPLDGIIANANGYPCLDLFRLEKMIPNYDGEKCTYKGKPNYSMRKALLREYGKEAMELVKQMI